MQYIDPHSCGTQRCVFLLLLGCLTGGPAAQLSAGWWLSLLHLISNFSGPQLIRGPEGPFSLVWFSLPHLVSYSNSSGPPIGCTFASCLRAPKVDPFRLASSTQLFYFLQILTKPPRAPGAWRHPHRATPFRLGLLWHLSDTSIRPRAPALTPASMLHPKNPCAELKGSQPNQTRGTNRNPSAII